MTFIPYKLEKWTFPTIKLMEDMDSERILINVTIRDQEEGVT